MTLKERGAISEGEPHPMAFYAREWILENYTMQELYMQLEAMSSCAIEGNELAEICAETLNRLLHGKSYSDRYIMGLAWYLLRSKERDGKEKV